MPLPPVPTLKHTLLDHQYWVDGELPTADRPGRYRYFIQAVNPLGNGQPGKTIESQETYDRIVTASMEARKAIQSMGALLGVHAVAAPPEPEPQQEKPKRRRSTVKKSAAVDNEG